MRGAERSWEACCLASLWLYLFCYSIYRFLARVWRQLSTKLSRTGLLQALLWLKEHLLFPSLPSLSSLSFQTSISLFLSPSLPLSPSSFLPYVSVQATLYPSCLQPQRSPGYSQWPRLPSSHSASVSQRSFPPAQLWPSTQPEVLEFQRIAKLRIYLWRLKQKQKLLQRKSWWKREVWRIQHYTSRLADLGTNEKKQYPPWLTQLDHLKKSRRKRFQSIREEPD